MFYSTPENYINSLYEAHKNITNPNNIIQFSIYNEDFYPYADKESAYWTGFFI